MQENLIDAIIPWCGGYGIFPQEMNGAEADKMLLNRQILIIRALDYVEIKQFPEYPLINSLKNEVRFANYTNVELFQKLVSFIKRYEGTEP